MHAGPGVDSFGFRHRNGSFTFSIRLRLGFRACCCSVRPRSRRHDVYFVGTSPRHPDRWRAGVDAVSMSCITLPLVFSVLVGLSAPTLFRSASAVFRLLVATLC